MSLTSAPPGGLITTAAPSRTRQGPARKPFRHALTGQQRHGGRREKDVDEKDRHTQPTLGMSLCHVTHLRSCRIYGILSTMASNAAEAGDVVLGGKVVIGHAQDIGASCGRAWRARRG
jgi:hypothetical protein